jgi:hypothetical protein
VVFPLCGVPFIRVLKLILFRRHFILQSTYKQLCRTNAEYLLEKMPEMEYNNKSGFTATNGKRVFGLKRTRHKN